MNKTIDDLTEEEIGKLFPINIVPFDGKWTNIFEREKEIIADTLGKNIALRIEHFGSTAVAGLASKPTIDILVEIPELTKELKNRIIEKMELTGYHFIWRADSKVPYMMLVKGYTMKGFTGQTYHIHLSDKKHSLWDRLYFRDYLRNHSEVAKEYENLKIKLAEKHKYNREAYTRAKTDFITAITEMAKNQEN